MLKCVHPLVGVDTEYLTLVDYINERIRLYVPVLIKININSQTTDITHTTILLSNIIKETI